MLKEEETYFAWNPPFDTLFALGPFINMAGKGERIDKVRNFLRHSDLSSLLDKLRQIIRTYSQPILCQEGA